MGAIYILTETEWAFLKDLFYCSPVANASLHMQIKRYLSAHEDDHSILDTKELSLLVKWISSLSDNQKRQENKANRRREEVSRQERGRRDVPLYSKLIWLLKLHMNANSKANEERLLDRYHESI